MSNNNNNEDDNGQSLTITLDRDAVVVADEGLDAQITTHVDIILSHSFTALTQDGLQRIDEILGRYPNLVSFNMERLVHATTSIPVSGMIRILQHPNLRGLTDLRVLGARLQGTREEWRQLATRLHPNHLPRLSFVCMVEPMAWLPQIPSRALDPLLRVCANHSTLKFFSTNLISGSGVSLPAMEEFCQSPHIMGMHLVDPDVVSHQEQIFSFLKAMQTNTKVWFLSLSFAHVITSDHGKALAELLQRNTALSNVSIKSKQPLQEDLVAELARGLATDACVVQEFTLEGTGTGPVVALGEPTRSAISHMLERNTTLQKVKVGNAMEDSLEQEIDTMMRLNRAGRKALSKASATSREWIDMLCQDQVRNHLDCLYYLLSKNPQVIYRGRQQEVHATANPEGMVQSRKRKREEMA